MSWTSLIPQVFYDGIARVVAGAVFILITVMLWGAEVNSRLMPLFEQGAFLVSMALLIGSYAIGILLTGLANIPGADVVFGNWSAKDEAWKKITIQFNDTFQVDKAFVRPADSIAIDSIRLRNPVAGARLVKLKAERALAKNLFVGAVIQFALFVIFSRARGLFFWHALLLLLLLGSATVLLARHLGVRHATGLYNHWILVVKHPELLGPENKDVD